MQTTIFTANDLKKAAALIKQGELVAFPTETVYGLGADALNEDAVKKVYQVKGRPSDNPLIVHVQDFASVQQYVKNYPIITQKLIDTFWPGPLTLIFKVKPKLFPDVVTGGLETVAFRMPKNLQTLTLIKEARTPLVGPSANTSGKPSPTTSQHVLNDLRGKIAGILDDGPTTIGVESTVLDLTTDDGIPLILRPGAITKEALEQVIGSVSVDKHLLSEHEKPKAPGMKYKHYAPDVPVWIVDNDQAAFVEAVEQANAQDKKIGIFTNEQLTQQLSSDVNAAFSFGENTVANATKYLFAGLRMLDKQEVDLILAQAFPEQELGTAYMNRLKKAANQKFFKDGFNFK